MKIVLLIICVILDSLRLFLFDNYYFVLGVCMEVTFLFVAILISKIKRIRVLILNHKKIYFFIMGLQIIVPIINFYNSAVIENILIGIFEFIDVFMFFIFVFHLCKEKDGAKSIVREG